MYAAVLRDRIIELRGRSDLRKEQGCMAYSESPGVRRTSVLTEAKP